MTEPSNTIIAVGVGPPDRDPMEVTLDHIFDLLHRLDRLWGGPPLPFKK